MFMFRQTPYFWKVLGQANGLMYFLGFKILEVKFLLVSANGKMCIDFIIHPGFDIFACLRISNTLWLSAVENA